MLRLNTSLLCVSNRDRTLLRMEKEYEALETSKKTAATTSTHTTNGITTSKTFSSLIPGFGRNQSKIPQEVKGMTRSKSKDDMRRPSIVMGWDDDPKGLEVRGSNVLSASNRSNRTTTTRGKK